MTDRPRSVLGGCHTLLPPLAVVSAVSLAHVLVSRLFNDSHSEPTNQEVLDDAILWQSKIAISRSRYLRYHVRAMMY